jgi:hypothetical protein
MSNLVTVFNDHFIEFLNDIQNVFPDDPDVLTAKNALIAIRKANPKMLVKIWTQFVVLPYQKQIEDGDINFFITKDYSQDVVGSEHADKIMQSIDRLRNPVKMMNNEDRNKTMKYLQNLSKLALMIPQ